MEIQFILEDYDPIKIPYEATEAEEMSVRVRFNTYYLFSEKEFIADDSSHIVAVFMRNNIPIYLDIQRSKIPGRNIQQHAVIPFKNG